MAVCELKVEGDSRTEFDTRSVGWLLDGTMISFLTAPNHTANDMLLIPTEKSTPTNCSIRKAREAFLISKGRTLLPHGLS